MVTVADKEFFVISVAAELAGMHAQTLRTYDRLGLVTPMRTSGGGRRYSQADVDLLRAIQRLTQEEGVNLAGIKEILALRQENARLRRVLLAEQDHSRQLEDQLAYERRRNSNGRSTSTEVVHVPRSTALVIWEPRHNKKKSAHKRDVS
ncbi:MAG: helix-turn-helix transcriptional regulator [Corynebacterium sp.]|nr:helix-turn-helix transcriptional regulator [Corynebacterium sp.]